MIGTSHGVRLMGLVDDVASMNGRYGRGSLVHEGDAGEGMVIMLI